MTRSSTVLLVLVALVAGIAGATATALVMRPAAVEAQQSTITAREFRVVDREGRTRARLTSPESGTVGLVLYDGQGRQRVHLMQDEAVDNRVDLRFLDTAERGRLSLSVSQYGAYIFVMNEQGDFIWSAP
jgi:hypothetical protein